MTFSPTKAHELAEALRASHRCKECHGDGFKTYSDTTCGRGGGGGQMITTADCHRCKGAGWIGAVDVSTIVETLVGAGERVRELEAAEDKRRKHPMAPEQCPVCKWTNVNLMNYGQPGKSRWMCHGCAAGAIQERNELAAALINGPLDDKTAHDEIVSLRSQLEALGRERDEANAICSKVNDAVNRAGIHCALYFWEAIDQIAAERDLARAECERLTKELSSGNESFRQVRAQWIAERDSLKAEVERMRAVAEAATAMHHAWRTMNAVNMYQDEARRDLRDALNVLAAPEKE